MSEIVYVLSNPAMPDLVKIGKTNRDSIDKRLKELFTTSVPVPFECEYACEVEDSIKVENALHIAFGPYKINPKREFFKIETEQAIVILKVMSKKDITSNVQKEVNKSYSKSDKEAGERLKIQRRPPLDFYQMGINNGEKLEYLQDDINVTVVGKKKVNLNGKEVSLTAATRELMGIDFNIQPTQYWMYKGRNLRDIYNDTYTFE
jgi:hypothetical protein